MIKRLLFLFMIFMVLPKQADASDRAEAVACPMSLAEIFDVTSKQLGEMSTSRAIAIDSVYRTIPLRFGLDLTRYLGRPTSRELPGPNAVLIFVASGELTCAVLAFYPDAGEVLVEAVQLAYPTTTVAARVDAAVNTLLGSQVSAGQAPIRSAEKLVERGAAPLDQPNKRDAEITLGRLADILIPERWNQRLAQLNGSLTIVPALNFGRVPFAALDPDGDGRPLIEHAIINVEASLKNVVEPAGYYVWEPTISNALVVGDPDSTNTGSWNLPRLSGAAEEAREIARLMGANPLIGKEATKQAVLQRLESADYIHIAAHGIANTQDPIDGSFLALSGARLTAREIQQLNLEHMPVVVLSACQSALGGSLDAGIIGVSRGFLIGGATVVIASLWNVDDEATAEIMVEFAKNLSKSSPAAALRSAQLAAREKWRDPRIWASFIVFGSRVGHFGN